MALKNLLHMILLIGSVSGCGIEVGNPALGSAADLESTHGGAVLVEICQKLGSCYSSLSDSECRSGVLASSSIDTELGLTAAFGTYQEIIDAEKDGSITPSSSASSNCQTDIIALTCADAGVVAAYSEADPNNFSNVYQLIPATAGSCPDVY